MLAQNFKTADELEIQEDQKAALIKTLVLFETGKLRHTHIPSCYYTIPEDDQTEFTGHFNMLHWYAEFKECGTIACIGGTAEMVGGVQFGSIPSNLQELFSPCISQIDYGKITTAQAARALRSYLMTGNANWKAALANERN